MNDRYSYAYDDASMRLQGVIEYVQLLVIMKLLSNNLPGAIRLQEEDMNLQALRIFILDDMIPVTLPVVG